MHTTSLELSRVANDTYGHGRRLMPEAPWWDNLEPSFHKFPDDFWLEDNRTQFMIEATARADILLRSGMAVLIAGLCLPGQLLPSTLGRDLALKSFYTERLATGDPTAFFQRPRHRVEVERHPADSLAYKPRDGRCELLSFVSPFEPVCPNMRERYLKYARNRRAWAQYWRHDDGPKQTLIVVHGFMADPYWINSRFLALPWFYEQGYDILLFTLPFHGRRRPAGSPFSGHGVIAHGIAHTNECFAHAVHDLQLFMDFLEKRGAPQFGMTGISLGGYTTALMATLEERLHVAIPNVPAVSLVDLILEWFPAGPLIKTMMRMAHMGIRDARHMLAVSSPLSYKPLLPVSRRLIIAGAGDRLASPKHSRLLWDHWDRCRLHWFPGNHVIHLDQGRYLREMAHFMAEAGFRA